MQHREATWTCSINMLHVYACCIDKNISLDMHIAHAAWKWSVDIRHRHEHRHAVRTGGIDMGMPQGNAAWTWRNYESAELRGHSNTSRAVKNKGKYQLKTCGHLPTSLVGGQISRMYSSNPGQYMYSACI